MIKTVLTRTIDRLAVVAVFALLAACEPNLPPAEAGQPIPSGPTPGELDDYATAQMQYRFGLATGNGDAVAKANETFRQIPREIFFRQDPRLFDAKLVCERNQVAGGTATSVAAPFGPQCRNIEWRYNEATIAIRHDLEARITAADYTTIAQAGTSHPWAAARMTFRTIDTSGQSRTATCRSPEQTRPRRNIQSAPALAVELAGRCPHQQWPDSIPLSMVGCRTTGCAQTRTRSSGSAGDAAHEMFRVNLTMLDHIMHPEVEN
jgi:hypothetical protein